MQSASLTIENSVLKWARLSIGLTLDEVAEKVKVEKEQLASWENETSEIAIPTIKKLAKTYKRPVTALFLEVPPEGIVPPDFRTLDSVEIEKLSLKSRLAIRRAQRNRVFFSGLLNKKDIFNLNISLDDDIQKISSFFRKKLNISIETQSSWEKGDVLNNWVDAIESLNIPVFQTSLPIEEFRGFCLRGNDLVPAIVLNQGDFPRGRVFTLFHELYHVFLKQEDIDSLKRKRGISMAHKIIELKANDFAASFLVPETTFLDSDFVRDFKKNKDARTVSKLASYFNVSEDVIFRRLLTFDFITSDEYEKKQKELNEIYKNLRAKKKKSYEGKEYIPNHYRDRVYQTGFSLGKKAFDALSEGKVSTYDLVNFFDVKTAKLVKIKENIDKHYSKQVSKNK